MHIIFKIIQYNESRDFLIMYSLAKLIITAKKKKKNNKNLRTTTFTPRFTQKHSLLNQHKQEQKLIQHNKKHPQNHQHSQNMITKNTTQANCSTSKASCRSITSQNYHSPIVFFTDTDAVISRIIKIPRILRLCIIGKDKCGNSFRNTNG